VVQAICEFIGRDSHSGRSALIVINPKQSIAISLNESEELKKSKNNLIIVF